MWKDGGIGAGDTFGKDGVFTRPKFVCGLLNKVHYETPSDTARGNSMIANGIADPQAYTSDKVLVYGEAIEAPQGPFFLLAFLEPGHQLMNDHLLLEGVALHFQDEVRSFSRDYPQLQADWVTSGFN